LHFLPSERVEQRWNGELVAELTGLLLPGEVLRVHCGKENVGELDPEHRSGADHHLFSRRRAYLLDAPATGRLALCLEAAGILIDVVNYAAGRAPGQMLVRSGDDLVSAGIPLDLSVIQDVAQTLRQPER